jgi:hypothetical protein
MQQFVVDSFCPTLHVKLKSMSLATNLAFGVATPLWDKCEGEAHTPKSGKLESSGTPKN